jgi:hypothetical protein
MNRNISDLSVLKPIQLNKSLSRVSPLMKKSSVEKQPSLMQEVKGLYDPLTVSFMVSMEDNAFNPYGVQDFSFKNDTGQTLGNGFLMRQNNKKGLESSVSILSASESSDKGDQNLVPVKRRSSREKK